MGFQRLAGGVVWSVLLVITWLHTQFVAAPVQWWLDNVVGTAEESAKATVRELFSFCARLINGIASWIVSVFVDRDFLRRSTGERRTRAWKAFWANSSEAGTLNAIIEREGLIDRRSPSPTPRPRRSSIKRYNWGWGLWRRPSQGRSAQSTGGGMKRSGSDLFNRPSGFAVAERLERRTGLLESMKVSLEIAIETVFDAFRSAVRTALLLRAQPPNTFPPASQGAWDSSRSGAGHRNGIHRTHSFGSWEEIGVWTASDVIIQAGYPLEEHVITTSDGYILTMQRIPRKDSREVVFFHHGVLDTSLGWVSNGAQASQAFSAFDRGADVWLGNSRANPPRAHSNPARSGAAYWAYSINELGMEDVAALVDRIHAVKCAELGSATGRAGVRSSGIVGGPGGAEATPGPSPRPSLHKRSGSDSALAALQKVSVAADGLGLDGTNAHPPNEDLIRAHNLAVKDRATRSLDLEPSPVRLPFRSRVFSMFLPRTSPSLAATDDAQPQSPTSSPPASPADEGAHEEAQTATGVTRPLRRRSSLLRLFGRDSASVPARPTAAARLQSPFASPSSSAKATGGPLGEDVRSFAIEEEREEAGGDGEVEENSTERHKSAKKGPPLPPLPLSLSVSDRHAHGSARGRTPDIGSVGCTPRSSGLTPPSSRLMTPDRMSVGGREQVPTEWFEATVGAAWDPFSETGNGSASARLSHSHSRGVDARSPAGDLAASEAAASAQPYRLQAVGHSLGGASLLIYAVMCRVLGRPDHLSRLVLLTPAGFHRQYPKVAAPFLYILPVVMKLLNRLRPGVGAPVYIPSSLLRYITFKLTVDLQQVPALNELTRAALRLLLNGDASEWDRALQMPHYAVASMPALSLHTGAHFIQLISTQHFELYDYGSAAANRKRYGTDRPPDVAAHYHLLTGLPVDLVAGRSDGVIARDDVAAHFDHMQWAGLEVTYKELDVGHLDMTFGCKDEVLHYVMSRLRLGGLDAAQRVG